MITDTNTYLLVGLKDQGNDGVWSEFYARYRPILVSFGRRLGLSQEDAQDAAQNSMLAFTEAYHRGQYDRERGRLRNWLFGIARNQIHLLQRRDSARSVAAIQESHIFKTIPGSDGLETIWEDEWRKGLIEACLEEARRHLGELTLQAFVLFVLQEWPADRVASHLSMTRNAVFKAKRRVLSHMREAYRLFDTCG